MNDVADLIKRDLEGAAAKREANRRAFPDTAEIVDRLSAVFGPVKVLHAVENGREIGKPQPFDGTDISKVIAADDWHNAAQKRGNKR
jgi:hypothetical protein